MSIQRPWFIQSTTVKLVVGPIPATSFHAFLLPYYEQPRINYKIMSDEQEEKLNQLIENLEDAIISYVLYPKPGGMTPVRKARQALRDFFELQQGS